MIYLTIHVYCKEKIHEIIQINYVIRSIYRWSFQLVMYRIGGSKFCSSTYVFRHMIHKLSI